MLPPKEDIPNNFILNYKINENCESCKNLLKLIKNLKINKNDIIENMDIIQNDVKELKIKDIFYECNMNDKAQDTPLNTSNENTYKTIISEDNKENPDISKPSNIDNILKEKLDIIKKEHETELINIKESYTKDINELTKLNQKLQDKVKTNEINPISPSNSNDTKILHGAKYKHKFLDKSLHILERCNVIAYKYNLNLNNVKDKKDLEILEFIGSEHKVLVRFNSNIAERLDKKDKKIWEEIFKFKIDNSELSNSPSTKSNFKYKILRCKELYDKYGENLSRFQIYVNYIGKLTQKEWDEYLIEFDKLYNDKINVTNLCQYKYKDDKICNRFNCTIKHRDSK
jgi:hypothetical protein